MLHRWFRRRSPSLNPGAGEQASLPDRQAGFSLPELMLVLAIIMLLVTISLPRMRRAKERAEEAAAVQTMKGIHTAQEAHRITSGSYAPNFKLLGSERGSSSAPSGGSGAGGGGEDVMVHQGYIFRMERTAPDEYTVTAEPVLERSTRPYYSMNQTGRIGGLASSGGGGFQGGGGSGGGGQDNEGGGGTPPPEEDKKDQPPQ